VGAILKQKRHRKNIKFHLTRHSLELAHQWLEVTRQFLRLDSDSKKFWMTLTRPRPDMG